MTGSLLPFLPALLLAPQVATGQTPDDQTFVADLNQNLSEVVLDAGPRVLLSEPQRLWFTIGGPDGRELWTTDGTTGGTAQVADVFPGPTGAFDTIDVDVMPIAPLPDGSGAMVFSAVGPGIGLELWRVDGPQGPATLLADIHPGLDGSAPEDFTAFAGRLWFLADDGEHGRELWSTDGTPSGTRLELDLAPGPDSDFGDPTPLLDGRLMADANTLYLWREIPGLPGGYELLASDGTAPGTSTILSVPGSRLDEPLLDDDWADLGSRTVFVIYDSPGGTGLPDGRVFSTDGTAVGTVELSSSLAFDLTTWLVQDGSRAFVRTDRSIVVTDGTPGGTLEIVGEGLDVDRPTNAPGALVGGQLYFSARARKPINLGTEPIVSDGTLAGTQIVADLVPGLASSGPRSYAEHQGLLYFRANLFLDLGVEVYVSDGTAAGIQLAGEIVPGFFSPDHGDYEFSGSEVPLSSTPGGLVLPAGVTDLRTDLWRFTGSGPELLFENPAMPTGDSGPSQFVRVGTRLFFLARTAVEAKAAVWMLELGNPVPQFVDLFGNGDQAHGAWVLVEHDGGVAFRADVGSNSDEWAVWWTNGVDHRRLTPDGVVPTSEPMVSVGETLYFAADGPGIGVELHRSNGLEQDAIGLDVTPGPEGTHPSRLASIDGEVAFIDSPPPPSFPSNRLWFSDGTLAGTRTVAPVGSGPNDFVVYGIAESGGLAYLSAVDGCCGSEPFVSDGTPEGTFQLVELAPGFEVSQVSSFVPFGDRMVFTSDIQFAPTIWITDGTTQGTQVYDATGGPVWVSPAGDTLFHRSFQGIYYGDGTPGAFTQVPGLGFQEGLVDPPSGFQPAVGEGVIAFAADELGGSELWTIRAGEDDPVWAVDSWPGSGSGFPQLGGVLGSELYFNADYPTAGRELHSTSLATLGIPTATAIGYGCGDTLGGLDPRGGAVLGQPLVIDIEGAQPGGAAFLFLGLGLLPVDGYSECGLLIQSPVLLQSAVADVLGDATFTAAVPADPALIGRLFHVQGLALGAGGPFVGFGSLSNAIEFLIGS